MSELMAEIHENDNGVIMRSHMTLRDWFAGQALAGLAHDVAISQAGKLAYEYADAMMEARK